MNILKTHTSHSYMQPLLFIVLLKIEFFVSVYAMIDKLLSNFISVSSIGFKQSLSYTCFWKLLKTIIITVKKTKKTYHCHFLLQSSVLVQGQQISQFLFLGFKYFPFTLKIDLLSCFPFVISINLCQAIAQNIIYPCIFFNISPINCFSFFTL